MQQRIPGKEIAHFKVLEFSDTYLETQTNTYTHLHINNISDLCLLAKTKCLMNYNGHILMNCFLPIEQYNFCLINGVCWSLRAPNQNINFYFYTQREAMSANRIVAFSNVALLLLNSRPKWVAVVTASQSHSPSFSPEVNQLLPLIAIHCPKPRLRVSAFQQQQSWLVLLEWLGRRMSTSL